MNKKDTKDLGYIVFLAEEDDPVTAAWWKTQIFPLDPRIEEEYKFFIAHEVTEDWLHSQE